MLKESGAPLHPFPSLKISNVAFPLAGSHEMLMSVVSVSNEQTPTTNPTVWTAKGATEAASGSGHTSDGPRLKARCM
jgi:hypothetical protein